ncbi:carbon-nitrogen hydrolase family protein [Arthrobacter sp. ISL-28]|uniref:carbon-nitrogen hydrolase family protein n=1 Tax=Arthrobacter sp. ISL-28 TaxID=2819108 RepID=UPI001BE8557F|nr:carbon-nitrogen hydrolase family protein [Arthrobacter sp. ISL-28]MBT2520162.1 carbon-nitrogen hydrolase family protein [Arthrobacter sp. ISL-28]
MRIAVAQFTSTPNVRSNLDVCVEFIQDARESGASLVVFPEASLCPPPGEFDPAAVAEPIDGPFVAGLRTAARDNAIGVVVGTFTPGPEGRPYNTVVAIGDDGSLMGRYDKLHLYDAFNVQESKQITPGPHPDSRGELLTFQVGDITFGVATCYDLRFPELFRALIDTGVQAIILPAAWMTGSYKEVHWKTLTAARAIENTVYVIAANQGPFWSVGNSSIIDPVGRVVAQAGDKPELITAVVDAEEVRLARRLNPSVNNRRFHVQLRNNPLIQPT